MQRIQSHHSRPIIPTLVILAILSFCISPTAFLNAAEAPAPAANAVVGNDVVGTHQGTRGEEAPRGMVQVPAGRVQVGISTSDAEKFCDGQKGILDVLSRAVPNHKVKVEEFFCDLYEVTNAQFQIYLEKTGQAPSKDLMTYAWKEGETYPEGEANFPIRNVTYREADAFSRWCGKRIPTEIEWLRAASGDDGRTYAWGNEWDKYKCSNKRNTLSPVGSYDAGKSPFGIYDMTGSMWEWTSSNFTAFAKWKAPKMKIGRKTVEAAPDFNGQNKVVKGGHYRMGDLQNRLDIREGTLPSNNLDSLGFRCVKDPGSGTTILHHALSDLEGSSVSEKDVNPRGMYAIEITDFTDGELSLIQRFDAFLICPIIKANTTLAKIKKESQDKPQPIGVLYSNLAIEEPNLPPGSYVLAYRHKGLSTADKKADYEKEEARRRKEEKARKAKEEAERIAAEKAKKEAGIEDKPKSQAEIDAEKARKKAEAEMELEDERIRKEEAAALAAKERLGIIASAKNHINYPRDKNLIVFMNTNDTIVGYLEVETPTEDSSEVPIRVVHGATSGMTEVEMGLGVLPRKVAKLNFTLKLTENPF